MSNNEEKEYIIVEIHLKKVIAFIGVLALLIILGVIAS